MNYCLKIYVDGSDRMVAVCDHDILGKTFEHNGVTIGVNEKFYGDINYTEKEVIQELIRSTSVNAMGKNICNLLVKIKMAHPYTVLWFDAGDKKIGHVLVVG